MSDESFPPADAYRPATTIWERYQFIRRVISLVMLVPVGTSLVLPIYAWIKLGEKYEEELFRDPLGVANLLLGIQSAFCVGLAWSLFGRGQIARMMGVVLIALWLIMTGLIVYNTQNNDLFLFAILTVSGFSIFFLNYLLWRTNNDR